MSLKNRIKQLEDRSKAKNSMFYVVNNLENDVFELDGSIMNTSEFEAWENSLDADDIVFVVSRRDEN